MIIYGHEKEMAAGIHLKSLTYGKLDSGLRQVGV
jgi:hypothetical protein